MSRAFNVQCLDIEWWIGAPNLFGIYYLVEETILKCKGQEETLLSSGTGLQQRPRPQQLPHPRPRVSVRER